ncbi:MAG: hypothetical protein GY941_05870, partial [Planctomycetes bacterium]|nr:hypothetical protein [Planctomycetota bacterium]
MLIEAARCVRLLSTGCETSWAAVQDAAGGGGEQPSREPVVRALRTLAGGDFRILAVAHRVAATETRRRSPLGFAWLVLEEARQMRSAVTRLERLFALFQDPWLLGGYSIRAHDVLARTAAAIGTRGKGEQAERAFASAELHLAQGTGDREVEAAVLRARGLHRQAEGDLEAAGALLTRAAELLRGASPADLRADALWQLSELHRRRDSEDRAMPARLLVEALEILDAVPRELNPWLRVRLARRLAQTLFEAADARRGVQARAWKWTLKRLSKQLPTGTDLHGQSEVLARAAPALTEIHREIFDGEA